MLLSRMSLQLLLYWQHFKKDTTKARKIKPATSLQLLYVVDCNGSQTSRTGLPPTPSGEHPQCPGNWARRGGAACYNVSLAALCHNRDIIAAQVSRPRHSPARATWPGHVSWPARLRAADQRLRSAGNGMCLTTGSRTAPRPACGLWTGDPSSGVICIVHGHCSSNHGTR